MTELEKHLENLDKYREQVEHTLTYLDDLNYKAEKCDHVHLDLTKKTFKAVNELNMLMAAIKRLMT